MLINFAARRLFLFTACVFDLSLGLHVWVRTFVFVYLCVCVARRVVSCGSDRRERASDFNTVRCQVEFQTKPKARRRQLCRNKMKRQRA